jgi:hypothetical protein
VIILAQGRQERMGDAIDRPKQLLRLPACGDAPILARTLHQVARILLGTSFDLDHAMNIASNTLIEVVAWDEVHRGLPEIEIPYLRHPMGGRASVTMNPDLVSLPDPGNSSLKGIHRHLERKDMIAGRRRPDRTVVLLGDVIYSWACLEALFADLANPRGLAVRFVGTSDISPSGGELWGLAWMHGDGGHDLMTSALEYALRKHPPFDQTYQPGQLRRWMWALHPAYQTTSRYTAIDDYTKDIDLPSDVLLIAGISERAMLDDREHGVLW